MSAGEAAPAPARLRLFVALDLPEAVRAGLARFRDSAAADAAVWRPLAASSFHVTLAFLGHHPAEDATQVAAVLDAVEERASLELAVGAALLLPPRGARVLTVALEDADGALGRLQADVSAGLAAAGLYEPEARPFRPHVTVARLRAGARAPRTVAAAPEAVAFTADAVTLYRSRLGRGGVAYEPRFTRTLG
jgi:2'-5' RNA ligase